MAKPKPAAQRAKGRSKPSRPGGSLRALARLLGVSHTAVEKAIVSGRLAASVGRTARGKPRILDLKAAAREWREHGGKANGNGKEPSKAATYAEAQLRVAIQRELKLDLENQQKQGALVNAAAARRESFEYARTVRDAILNVPDRVAAELAAETDAGRVHRRLEQELRAALVSLADALDEEPRVAPARGAGPGHVVQ